jgi:hypothetical protein
VPATEAAGVQADGGGQLVTPPGGLPAYRYRNLLEHLSTLDRQAIVFAGQKIEKLTTPTPVQARAFELLGVPVPLSLR